MFREELGEYISELDAAAAACARAEDRRMYQIHLAAAARMLVALSSPEPMVRILPLLEAEDRTYGQWFLSGSGGARATAAFQKFAAIVRRRKLDALQ